MIVNEKILLTALFSIIIFLNGFLANWINFARTDTVELDSQKSLANFRIAFGVIFWLISLGLAGLLGITRKSRVYKNCIAALSFIAIVYSFYLLVDGAQQKCNLTEPADADCNKYENNSLVRGIFAIIYLIALFAVNNFFVGPDAPEDAQRPSTWRERFNLIFLCLVCFVYWGIEWADYGYRNCLDNSKTASDFLDCSQNNLGAYAFYLVVCLVIIIGATIVCVLDKAKDPIYVALLVFYWNLFANVSNQTALLNCLHDKAKNGGNADCGGDAKKGVEAIVGIWFILYIPCVYLIYLFTQDRATYGDVDKSASKSQPQQQQQQQPTSGDQPPPYTDGGEPTR